MLRVLGHPGVTGRDQLGRAGPDVAGGLAAWIVRVLRRWAARESYRHFSMHLAPERGRLPACHIVRSDFTSHC